MSTYWQGAALTISGAFSSVYKAQHRETGELFAIKVVRKQELNATQVSYNSSLMAIAMEPAAVLHCCSVCFSLCPLSHAKTFFCVDPCASRYCQKETKRSRGGHSIFIFSFLYYMNFYLQIYFYSAQIFLKKFKS